MTVAGGDAIAGGRPGRQDRPVADDDLVAAVGAMTPERVDQVLAELAAAVAEIRDDNRAAERTARAAEAAGEDSRNRFGPFGDSPVQARPQYALLALQEQATQSTEQELRTAYEEMAAWWAHSATLALQAAVGGAPVTEAAVAVIGPWHFLSAADLADLVRSGVLPELPPNVEPEDLRFILWGTAWQRHRLPELPAAADLAVELTRAGVSATAVTGVIKALGAVEAAVKARETLAALDELEEGDPSPEHVQSVRSAAGLAPADLSSLAQEQWALYEGRVDRVVDYAATVTHHLPGIRVAAGPSPGPRQSRVHEVSRRLIGRSAAAA